jgi:hypothetical protein
MTTTNITNIAETKAEFRSRGRKPRQRLLVGSSALALAFILNITIEPPPALAVICSNAGVPAGPPTADASDLGNLGSFNTACGRDANASGNSSRNTAIGGNANASGGSSTNTALGSDANANGGSNANVAIGTFANASGTGNSNALTGNIAIGRDATASGTLSGNVAIGSQALATGNQRFSVAIGAFSRAEGENSTAIGPGAVATAPNQMMFGRSESIYAMPGITSATSRAAQTGAVQAVTSDANGNLATANLTTGAAKRAQGAPTHLVTSNASGALAAHTPQEFGLATTGDVSRLQGEINHLGQRDNALTEGIAAAAALAQPLIFPGQHFAMRAGWGGYGGSNALGFSAAGMLANNLLRPGSGTFAVDGGVGIGTDEGEVVGRVGANFGW